MTEREAFEQLFQVAHPELSLVRFNSDSDIYFSSYTDLAWQGYKAATDAQTHKAIYEDEV